MTKTTNSTRIAALEATVAGQAETIEFLLERIERITDRVNFLKKWNREQDQAIDEMPSEDEIRSMIETIQLAPGDTFPLPEGYKLSS